MSNHNHGPIEQEFESSVIDSPRVIAGIGGMMGKLSSPTAQNVFTGTMEDFIPTADKHACGHARMFSRHVPQSAGTTVLTFAGTTLASFANGYTGTGDEVFFSVDLYWSNDHSTGVTLATTYGVRGSAPVTSFTSIPGLTIGSAAHLFSITDDFGASGFAANGYMVLIGGGI